MLHGILLKSLPNPIRDHKYNNASLFQEKIKGSTRSNGIYSQKKTLKVTFGVNPNEFCTVFSTVPDSFKR